MRRYILGLALLALVAVGTAAAGLIGQKEIAPAPEVVVRAPAPPAVADPKPAEGAPPTAAGPGTGTSPAAEQIAQTTEPSAKPAEPGAPTTAEMLEDRVLGKAEAPITIIEYASLTCPHCASFHTETLPQIKERYIDTGKAKLVYRDFPFDPVALRAAMLSRCAPRERYFGVLDVLFRSQRSWATAEDPLTSLAQTGRLAGVDAEAFEACMANEELMNGVVEKRLQGDQQHQVTSTPTFIIQRGGETEKIVGAQPLAEFEAALSRLGS